MHPDSYMCLHDDMLHVPAPVVSNHRINQAQEDHAIRLWAEGWCLGDIAIAVGCTIYDLSPWLHSDHLPGGALHA